MASILHSKCVCCFQLLADYIAMVDDRDDKLARDLRPTSSSKSFHVDTMYQRSLIGSIYIAELDIMQ